MSKTATFVELCKTASEGTTNRLRLQEARFLASAIPLPPLEEQRRIVARIEELAAKVEEASGLRKGVVEQLQRALTAAHNEIIDGATYFPMAEVAPLTRRSVQVDALKDFYEIGIRSFGRGTFHKPPISGSALGNKRIFRIEEGDLLFNNVFAWEGAVAVAQKKDNGLVGSHRFITCVQRKAV